MNSGGVRTTFSPRVGRENLEIVVLKAYGRARDVTVGDAAVTRRDKGAADNRLS